MTGRRGVPTLVAALLLAAGLAACGGEPAVAPPSTSRAPAPEPTTATDPPEGMSTVLDVDFDQPGAPRSGGLDEGARVPSAAGGAVGTVRLEGEPPVQAAVVAGVQGAGLRLAEPCDPKAACPKAVVEFPDSPDLNPGTRDFRFGAALLLQPDETSKGSNVMQKGFNNGGASQWKLQVDGEKGRPSCVVVGADPAHEYVVTARTGVADGRWHVVECRREGTSLSVLVDGEVDASTQVDPATDVRPPSELRVGGKSLKPDNDQYFGALDDLFYLVASA